MATEFAHVSVVVPMLDEASGIGATLAALAPLRHGGGEVIVVDGGSTDVSVEIARPLADRVISSPRGRATQMNAGAAIARGRLLCFVHADTLMSARAVEMLRDVDGWGRFEVRLSGRGVLLGVIGWMMSRRSCLTGIATGDQCLFVARELFDTVGGFPEQPLMEDIEISKRLRRIVWPRCLLAPVVTDSRRWRRRGVVRTILLMWWLRWAYAVGVSPTRLAEWYR